MIAPPYHSPDFDVFFNWNNQAEQAFSSPSHNNLCRSWRCLPTDASVPFTHLTDFYMSVLRLHDTLARVSAPDSLIYHTAFHQWVSQVSNPGLFRFVSWLHQAEVCMQTESPDPSRVATIWQNIRELEIYDVPCFIDRCKHLWGWTVLHSGSHQAYTEIFREAVKRVSIKDLDDECIDWVQNVKQRIEETSSDPEEINRLWMTMPASAFRNATYFLSLYSRFWNKTLMQGEPNDTYTKIVNRAIQSIPQEVLNRDFIRWKQAVLGCMNDKAASTEAIERVWMMTPCSGGDDPGIFFDICKQFWNKTALNIHSRVLPIFQRVARQCSKQEEFRSCVDQMIGQRQIGTDAVKQLLGIAPQNNLRERAKIPGSWAADEDV